MKLPIIKCDKANHFIYGFVIFVLSDFVLNGYFSLGVVCVFAIGREIYNKYDYGGFDIWDIIWTITPAIILTFKSTIL